MKKLIYILPIMVLLSCVHDEPTPRFQVESSLTTNIAYSTTDLVVDIHNAQPDYKYTLLYSESSNMSDFVSIPLSLKDGKYCCHITGLKPGHTYYYQYRVDGSYNSAVDPTVSSFSTNEYTLATVSTSAATSISYTAAKVVVHMSDWGCDDYPEWGLCYSTSSEPTVENSVIQATKDSACSLALSNLSDNTDYFARVYARNQLGLVYGNTISFRTLQYVVPTCKTIAPLLVLSEAAICCGDVVSDGGKTIAQRGICYSATSAEPTTSDTLSVATTAGLGAFSCQLSNLTSGTLYYYRAYAINEMGISYGEVMTFTTTSVDLPMVTTGDVVDITSSTAVCSCIVTTSGSEPILTRGVCYSRGKEPTVGGSVVTCGSGAGSFAANLSGLKENTTYYIRAYASNANGVAYGEIKSFTTQNQ